MSNAQARWHSDEDEGISVAGRKNSEAAAERLRVLAKNAVDLIVSSHLRRAVETAQILAAAIGTPGIVSDPQLAERDMGDWSGRAPAEVDALWPGVLAAWIAGRIPGPPGGEPDSAVARRARESLLRHARGGWHLIVVVTHGGVIRALRREAGPSNDPIPHLGGSIAWADTTTCRLKLGHELLLGDPSVGPLT